VSESPAKPEMGVIAQFLTLGSTMGGAVALGAALGVGADQLWGSSPIGLLVGLGLGIVGAITALVTLLRRWSSSS
jgi:F0F1-type ATP synthase assembly protein I